MADPVNTLRAWMQNRTPSEYTAESAPADLAPLYNALAPAPNTEYGNILPFARDTQTGETRWAMPNILREGLGGMLDLASGVDTGQVTPRAAETLAFGGVGAGGTLALRGALTAGGSRRGSPPGLPMDQASRMARAREMGFDPDLRLYHGTAGPDFREFGFGLGAPQSGGLPSPGLWASQDPRYANALAHDVHSMGNLDGTRVLPLVARKGKSGDLKVAAGDTPLDIHNAILGAWHDGYDSVRVLNYNTLPDGTPVTSWVYRNPNQLRSVHAVFDPARRESADLLAIRAVPAPVGVPQNALAQPQGPTPEQRDLMNPRTR